MKLRVMTAVLACKLCRALIRLLGRGGTDFPGRVALKLCPNLLGRHVHQRQDHDLAHDRAVVAGRWNLLLCK